MKRFIPRALPRGFGAVAVKARRTKSFLVTFFQKSNLFLLAGAPSGTPFDVLQ
jgi:hypothetical protein